MYLNFHGRIWDADSLDSVGNFVTDGVAQGQADDQHVGHVVQDQEKSPLETKKYFIKWNYLKTSKHKNVL